MVQIHQIKRGKMLLNRIAEQFDTQISHFWQQAYASILAYGFTTGYYFGVASRCIFIFCNEYVEDLKELD